MFSDDFRNGDHQYALCSLQAGQRLLNTETFDQRECQRCRAVLCQQCEPSFGFLWSRFVSDRNPPQHQRWSFQRLEPIAPMLDKLGVLTVIGERTERLEGL